MQGHLNLILVRHAESSNNTLYDTIRKTLGPEASEAEFLQAEAVAKDPDPALSERGLQQLDRLAGYDWHDYFVQEGAFPRCKVYTSPMQRCLMTAQAVASSLRASMDGPVAVHPELYEEGGCYRIGEDGAPVGLPGARWMDIARRFPDFSYPQVSERGWYDRPRVESQSEFDMRAQSLVRWIWSMQQDALRAGQGALVLVTHGNIMSAIISTLLAGAPHQALYKHSNTGHTHIELSVHGDSRLVVCQGVNKVTHLLGARHLIGGDHSVDDRWIQPFAKRPRG